MQMIMSEHNRLRQAIPVLSPNPPKEGVGSAS